MRHYNNHCLDGFAWKIFPKIFKTCAVVGSSDILRWYPMQQEIEEKEVIWRINHAPVRSFESLVGNRTEVRIMNHVWSDVRSGKLQPKKHEFLGLGNEFENTICDNSVCISTSSSRYMSSLHKNAYNSISRCKGNVISAGMIAVAAALRSCSNVSLYGFFPECCDSEHMFPGLNYKYYHNNASRWVCCSGGREDMHTEYMQYIAHPRIRLTNVNVVVGSLNMPTCAVVGSAWTATKDGKEIDQMDIVYRVNHAPMHGYENIVGSRTDIRTFGGETLSNFNMNDCKHIHCIFIRKYGDLKKYAMADSLRLKHAHNISIINNSFTRYIITFKAQFTPVKWKKIKVSGGLATTLYAMQYCSKVHVYLIEHNSSCCETGLPYNYYSSDKLHHKCCESSRETRDEYEAWNELISKGVVVHTIR